MHSLLFAFLLCVAPQVAAQDPLARTLFDSAVKLQCPDGAPPEIVDFQADLTVSLYEKEAAGPKTGKCTQQWQRGPARARYHRALSISGGKTTHLATDGTRFLLWEEGGTVQDLMENPALKDDLRTLKEELRRTEEMLDIFFLQRLDGDGVTFTFAGPATTIKRGDPAEDIAVRTLVRRKQGEADLHLLIGAADHKLYGVDRAATGDKASQSFRFDFHALGTGKGPVGQTQRLLLPRRVEFLENGRLVLEANARKANDLQFNLGLDVKAFGPPK